MYKNIGYHTRLAGNDSVKVVGGSFGGQFDQDTVERLVNSQFTVIIKPSGRAVFVDREGREVSLYISVDPETTTLGRQVKQADRVHRELIAEQEKEKALELQDLIDSMSYEELVKRLKDLK